MTQPQLPRTAKHMPISMDEMMHITARLNDILVAESGLLAKMKIKDVAPMQEEKQQLTQKLESFKQILATGNDAFVVEADPASREEMFNLAEDLMFNIEENFRLSEIARAVNQRVMQTITEAMADHQRVGVYGPKGHANAEPAVSLSINLNQRA
jgi:flagellar biosynthesis/type III secretory pathway chaperone